MSGNNKKGSKNQSKATRKDRELKQIGSSKNSYNYDGETDSEKSEQDF